MATVTAEQIAAAKEVWLRSERNRLSSNRLRWRERDRGEPLALDSHFQSWSPGLEAMTSMKHIPSVLDSNPLGTHPPLRRADARYTGEGAKGGAKGGWKPSIDRDWRLDVSYRGCPLQFLPPGARPGENLRRGDFNIRHDDAIRETLPPGEAAGLEAASRLRLVRIPDTGFILLCHASECNKRMWYQLDSHKSHLCETCLRDLRARALRR